MRHLILSASRRARAEHGFTMAAAMGGLLAVMLLSGAAFAAANGDLRLTGTNDVQKAAYAAAEAGIADYQYHLNQNPDYWRLCDDTKDKSPVTQPFTGTNDETREWRQVPESGAEYTIEVLPTAGYSTCDPKKPDTTMIDPDNGTFRVRATGRLVANKQVKRSIVATFKRTGFLDFLWFTDLEAQDPVVYSKLNACAGTPPVCYPTGSNPSNPPVQPTIETWSNTQCSKYWRDGRGSVSYPGKYKQGSSWYDLNPARKCTEIVYGDGEYIKGPFHTNDGIDICGAPIFGRDKKDRVEVSARADQAPRRPAGGGCADNANVQGTWLPGSPRLDPPATNAALKKDATLLYTGATRLRFNSNGTLTATNDAQSPKTKTFTLEPDTVIYVQSTLSCSYDPFNPFVYDGVTADARNACGDVSVSGTYTQSTTIGADDDIVIVDDLVGPTRPAGDLSGPLLGLIANNFIRVAHASTWTTSGSAQWRDIKNANAPECLNSASIPTEDLKIEAAILALQHQFTVDRYGCGAGLGALSINGTIAQKFRGPVGIGNGSSGYIKNYTYDNRLRFRSPPKFLDPVNVAWNVARQVEQSPAT
jgi:hypothetical protein